MIGDSVASWLPPFTPQLARFRREGRTALVVAFDLSANGIASETSLDAGLALLPLDGAGIEPVSDRRDGVSGIVPLVNLVEPGSYLLGLEVAVPSEGKVGRSRGQVDIPGFQPGSLGLSDILLVAAEPALPDSLVDALTTMRGSTRVRPGEAIGLFWEVYGVDPARYPVVRMSLRLIESDAGVMRRLGRFFGVVPDASSASVSWEEQTGATPGIGRSIRFTLPTLPGGTHTIELGMQVGGAEPIFSRKEITVGAALLPEIRLAEVTRRPALRRRLCGSVRTDLMVGNLGNLEAFQEFREAELFREYWTQAWMDPPVIKPTGFDCADWVRIRDEYYGWAAEAW
jgi:hypothetical protein